MSLYGDYIKEREGYDIVEDDHGFASFIIQGNECYIRDIYVHPDFRRDGLASYYAKKIEVIAKEKGANTLIGSVCTNNKINGANESLSVLLRYGFSILGTNGEMIYFRKEIK